MSLPVNLLTVILVLIFVWSVFRGVGRGFAREAGMFVLQVGYLVAAGLAIFLALRWTNAVTNWVSEWHPHQTPPWVHKALVYWQGTPQVAHLIAFLMLYFVISGILRAIVRPVAFLVNRTVPARFGKNRALGAMFGALSGIIRCVFAGAVVFAVLNYFSVPVLAKTAKPSRPYQYLQTKLYEPFLAPVLSQEFPVLSKTALSEVAQNIGLFVVPTPGSKEVGVVLVPKQIASLSHQIVAGQTTDVGKAKALYEWEIHHIKYDWKKYQDYVQYGKWDAQTPLQTLRTGKGVCADYALLYADLAHAAGITVQIDEGTGGSGNSWGSHAWNKVWDPKTQTWLPVDTTWGASQDAWFDPPHFSATHRQQKAILIKGASA